MLLVYARLDLASLRSKRIKIRPLNRNYAPASRDPSKSVRRSPITPRNTRRIALPCLYIMRNLWILALVPDLEELRPVSFDLASFPKSRNGNYSAIGAILAWQSQSPSCYRARLTVLNCFSQVKGLLRNI